MSAVPHLQPKITVLMRKLVPLVRLTNAGHNPPNRVLPAKLKALMASMDVIGLLHPVDITPEYEIIDGHRRTTAARLLGWKDIECNIIEGEPALIYASVNASAQRMTAADNLSVWLHNKAAVPRPVSEKHDEMLKVLGEPLCQRIASLGFSINVYTAARKTCRYCSKEGMQNHQAVADWLLNHRCIGQVGKAIDREESPALIWRAITKNKPLVFELKIGE